MQSYSAQDLRLLKPGLQIKMEAGGSSTNSINSCDSGHTEDIERRQSYQGTTQAWWSVDEHMKPRGVNVMSSPHQRLGMSLAARIFQQSDDSWDLSDSLADLYLQHDIISKKSWSSLTTFKPPSNLDSIDKDKWLAADTSHGFIRVYPPDSTSVCEVGARLIPCSLVMEAHSICQALGTSPNSLHVQFGGDVVRRLDPYEHPLVIQNEFLSKIGHHDVYRIQLEGLSTELGYLIRFYSGKPFFDNTFSRNHLSAYIDVKLGGVLSRWSKRLCTLTGTQIKIYKDKSDNGAAQVIQLCNGSVEECRSKAHPHHIKLTTQCSGPEKVIYLSFETFTDYSKWLKKCKKAVAKLPSNADLSSCNLEFLPETLFINGQLTMLNLRHNALKHRPTEEDIYTIGWLEDLPRFQCLRSLNLANNNLETFPVSICEMSSLVELNLGCNKIETVPTQIGNLSNLQALHLHNNHLSSIPNEITLLKRLVILVLAFNKFHQIPACVAQLTDVRTSECETIIMAGNLIESISSEVLTKLKHVKKIDLRFNNLSLPPTETLHMNIMEQLTHLDLRMNCVKELDLRCLRCLEYLNMERNELHTLQLNGAQLKTVFAANNELQQFLVSPKPEWLELIDLSYNKLEKLPEWLSDCSFLKRVNASHNKLQSLPSRIFADPQKLRQLTADHNEIRELPSEISNSVLEEINLHHNLIEALPDDFLSKLNKLKILNLSSNALTFLPPSNEIDDLNKLQELYLTQNSLTDDCFHVISGYHRLKILHLAYNELIVIDDRLTKSLELLEELNVSGNRVRSLPESLVTMPELRLLRAHSNLLKNLPNLTVSSTIKILDVACNKLLSVSASELASSTQLQSLDMQMTQFSIDRAQMESAKKTKQIRPVDSSGENREFYSSTSSQSSSKASKLCQLGFAESNGSRNKLCISVIHQMSLKEHGEALFAMFDGGRNSEIPKTLKKIIPSTLMDELEKSDDTSLSLKYTFLQAHKMLKGKGQNLGSSALLCYITRTEDSHKRFQINLGNCGDIRAVLCRGGEPLVLSKIHSVADDREEAVRIFRSDGIITEDNRVNATSVTSRSVGNSYLYPHVIPEPHVIKKTLKPEDQFIVIANSSLWRYLSPKESVEEIQYIANPVVAAKRLQDLAQGYGCKENVSVLVIQFNCNMLPANVSYSTLSNKKLYSKKITTESVTESVNKRKRPIPAPRISKSKSIDSVDSLTAGLNATVDLSSLDLSSIPTHNSNDVISTPSIHIIDTQQYNTNMNGNFPNKVAAVPISDSWESNRELEMNGQLHVLSQSCRTDSNSTLTEFNKSTAVNEFSTFDRDLAKLALYSSDTRLMDFDDSTSTLDSGANDGLYRISTSDRMNPLYQSDTRLLHASQIELKSTNYFSRPPLSCSSLEEVADEDFILMPPPSTAPPTHFSDLVDGRISRRRMIDLSNEQLYSPDGSYFSIDSSDDEQFYENVAAIKAKASMISRGGGSSLEHELPSESTLTRKGTTYQNYNDQGQVLSRHDERFIRSNRLDVSNKTSNISLIQYDDDSVPISIEPFKKPKSSNRQMQSNTVSKQNNIKHHISNGSSAYSSGSFVGSQESSIDTYL